MKSKIICLSVMIMLAFSMSAYADSTVTSSGVGEAYIGTTEPTEQALVMAVNKGDKITIEVSGATDSITLISYKGTEADSDTLQYINQYPKDTKTITYEIRDIPTGENGLYLLSLNDGTSLHKFYYKVGRPVLTSSDENVNYYKRVDFGSGENQTVTSDERYMGTTSVAYLATFTPGGETVTRYGFNVKLGQDSEKYADVFADGAVSGEADFQFGVTIYNLKPENDSQSIDDVLNQLIVTPYVNYGDTADNTDA